jgi:selenocysteine lyase/cysteine desulfurase
MNGHLADFPLSPDLVMLNHASFGVPTNEVMRHAERVRAELEADSHARVDVEALVPRMRAAAAAAADQLGLERGSLALTQNATFGGASLMRSLALPKGARVVVLSTEYASIVRGWQVRCAEAGAEFVSFTPPLPLESTDQLLEALEHQIDGDVHLAQLSLVSSSTAIRFPVEAMATWFRDRGALVVLDCAHGPGHLPIQPEQLGVAAMFGTLHKWFPTPRPVGFLWLDEQLRSLVRPAIVSLTWDADELVERFDWPGTYDPVPRLSVEVALEAWRRWDAAGDLSRCADLAEYASTALAKAGGVPTSATEFLPPRLRAASLPGVSRDALRAALDAAGVRAWTGLSPSGETVLRLALHVYNDEDDVDRVCDVVTALA